MVLYDHRGTLSALWTRVEAAVCGRRAQRLGLLAPGGAEEIQLCHGENKENLVSNSASDLGCFGNGYLDDRPVSPPPPCTSSRHQPIRHHSAGS